MDTDRDMFTLDPLALAVCEQYLEEWRAGRRPRLSVYTRRYPAYAAALADLVASLPPDTPDAPDALTPEPSAETPTVSFSERLWMGAGVSRALHDIFGSAASPNADEQMRRVAEERGVYKTEWPAGPSANQQHEDD